MKTCFVQRYNFVRVTVEFTSVGNDRKNDRRRDCFRQERTASGHDLAVWQSHEIAGSVSCYECVVAVANVAQGCVDRSVGSFGFVFFTSYCRSFFIFTRGFLHRINNQQPVLNQRYRYQQLLNLIGPRLYSFVHFYIFVNVTKQIRFIR